MTIHNLEDHISWLLENKPTIPSHYTRPIVTTTELAAEGPPDEEIWEPEETLPARPTPYEEAPSAPTITLPPASAFGNPLPTPAPTLLRADRQPIRPRHTAVPEDMARLASAQKSTHPTLVQSASAKPRTLTEAFKASCQSSAPARSKPSVVNPNSDHAISRIPQTPRQTRAEEGYGMATISQSKYGQIEMVDLTGDDFIRVDNETPYGNSLTGGSSTGSGSHRTLLWTADAAARASPQKVRKRKSDEITRSHCLRSPSPRKLGKENTAPTEDSQEFMDIDDLSAFDTPVFPRKDAIPDQPPPPYSTNDTFRPPSPIAGADIRPPDTDSISSDEEEVQVVETIHRTETRTRTTLSQRLSTERGIKRSLSRSPLKARPDNLISDTRSPTRVKQLKREASPVKFSVRSLSPSLQATNKSRPTKFEKSVADSEGEEDEDLDSCMGDVPSPKREPVSPFGARDIPMRGGSQNVAEQPQSASLEMSSKVITQPRHVELLSPVAGRATPAAVDGSFSISKPKSVSSQSSSTLGPDDKRIVELYTKSPRSIETHAASIKQQLDNAKSQIEECLDFDQDIPEHLTRLRASLNAQKKGLEALPELIEERAKIIKQRQAAKAQLIAMIDEGGDFTSLSNEVKVLNDSIRVVESKIAENLRGAGVTEATLESMSDEKPEEKPPWELANEFPMSSMKPNLSRNDTSTRRTATPAATAHQNPANYSAMGDEATRSNSTRSPARQPQRPMITKDDYGDFDEFDDDEAMYHLAESFDEEQRQPVAQRFPSSDEPARSLARAATTHTPRLPAATTTPVPHGKNMSLPVTAMSAALMCHPWSVELKKKLTGNFKLSGFRQNQLEAINATLAGKDVFVLMPTGGGKSLCYQLPAIIRSGKTQGVTIVISPLISLMEDQVAHLNKLKIQAFLLNGESNAEYRKKLLDGLRTPRPEDLVALLYVTPEMLTKSKALETAFDRLYQNGKLARIVIDEAHCVSQWGHDFRPDYKELGRVRQRFQGVPVMALTATATEMVKVDVMHNLGMKQCEIYTQSFNRPNLRYEVRTKGRGQNLLGEIADLIKSKYKKQTGIIYALSKKNCEELALKLREEHRIQAVHYHAGMTPEDKKSVQAGWQSGQWQVIVATIAFGMGIDKPDVRFVIHYTIPKSLEGYYQETGRAGRDGKPSGCYLYYGYQDTTILRKFIKDGEGSWEQKDRQHNMLTRMVQFCETRTECRRVQVLSYFGEKFNKEDCQGTCDNCASNATFELQDFTSEARIILKMMQGLGGYKLTLVACADVVRGVNTAKIREQGLDLVSGYGKLKQMKKGEVERLFYRLVSEHALSEETEVNARGFPNAYLRLGRAHLEFLQGRRKVKLDVCVDTPGSTKSKGKEAAPKRSGTGVRAALEAYAYPPSTNVSSPIVTAARKRAPRGRNPYIDDEAEESEAGGSDDYGDNNYDLDDFVVPDDHHSSDHESDDGFEPVREVAPQPRSTKKVPSASSSRAVGPRITSDAQMKTSEANLSDAHRSVIDHLIHEAKVLDEKIRNDKGLKQAIFTELQLRQMAIQLPDSLDDLLALRGVNKAKVVAHGARFLPLIRRYQQTINDMMGNSNDRDIDANHRIVVDLMSDEPDEPEETDYSEEEKLQESSAYFSHPPQTQAFNEELRNAMGASQSQAYEGEEHFSIPKRTTGTGRGGGFKGKGRGGFGSKKNYPKRNSGGSASTSASRVSKKRVSTSSRRTASGSGTTSARASTSRPQPLPLEASSGPARTMQNFVKRGGNGGGFAAMPTN